jgi:hypothetical protein
MGDIAEDGDVFGQDLAIVEFQRGDIMLGVDQPVIRPVRRDPAAQIDMLLLKRQAAFDQGDVVGQTAGTGGIIELQGLSPSIP